MKKQKVLSKIITQIKKPIIKFTLLCIIVAGYFLYLGILYDFKTSGVTSALTWSFFVLCTPVADAGFLLDFPLRLLFGIRMILSEVVVWGIAILTSTLFLVFFPHYYNTTLLTKLFYTILTTPYPYWSVILVSGIGTFVSIGFGDEVMDIASHSKSIKHKYGWVIKLVIMGIVIITYYLLISSLGMQDIIEK